MPNITVASLKKENDSLKEEIATLRRGFENLQKTLKQNDTQESSNGGEASDAITKDEALNTLQFYGKAYDDLRLEADESLQQLWSHLKVLTSRVDDIGNAIDEIQRYSYQYNVKIWVQMNVVPRSTGNTNSGTRELTLKCKLKCYFKPMNNPLGVSPSKGKQGTTRGKEKIFWPRWESNSRPTD